MCLLWLDLTIHTPLEHIHWIANNLAPALDNIPVSISVAVKLYITGAGVASQVLDESLKESSSEVMHISDSQLYSTILQSPFIQVNQGRPHLKQLISNEIGEATGRMSINGLYLKFTNCVLSINKFHLLVCGAHSLVNDTREAIRSPRPMDILRGGPTISFHVENFVSFLETLNGLAAENNDTLVIWITTITCIRR